MAIGDLNISGDGRRGDDGKDGLGYEGHAREFGVVGLNGEHGTTPTDGGDAQTVHVSLKRAKDRSSTGHIAVIVDKHDDGCDGTLPHSDVKEEFVHELGTGGSILISACGGAGGRGGTGGSGQGGGHGANGKNATVDMSGTNGGPGGDGGNAGDGTSGAKGGKAGNIKLFIPEEDLDLLLAMKPPGVQGGSGGKAGLNGAVGPGGSGGRGGASYTSRQTTRTEGGSKEITHHNVGGAAGPSGNAGAPSRALLVDGENGADGDVHIFVQKPDGQLAGPFASAYHLEVVDFDIVDGNEDGILEFGEEVVLRNIRVCNSGGTSSPSLSKVTMDGESTDWLVAPRTTHPLPRSIMSGSTVQIDGKFTFRIKRQKDLPPGRPFQIEDAIKLRGYMSGIDRSVPNFHTPKKVTLQHPIEMSKPRYLTCLTLGQEAVFSWKVDNKSGKDLGVDSRSKRQIKCAISQTGNSELQFGASKDKSLEIPINLLASRDSKDVKLLVKVPLNAAPYTKTEARVSLQLTPPDNTEPCTIQVYNIPIQVSSTFQHDPESKVLVVTNFDTSADDVEMWYQLICKRFGLKMDVWNVSVNGHLELLGGTKNTERQSLFQLYKGKTIIMLGNSFSYFDRGQRTAMDLIDPKDFATATFGGTNLLISGMDVDPKQTLYLTRLLRTSAYPQCREFATVKQLVAAVALDCHEKNFYITQYVCTPKPRGDNSQRCSSKANRAASELLKRLPNFRFLISWASADASVIATAGRVEVFPCTPYAKSKFILTRPVAAHRFEEMNEFAILLSLPFTTKLEMLWDDFGKEGSASKKVSTQSLAAAIELDMITELARFVNPNPSWPDTIEKQQIFSFLPRLNEFFNYNTSRPFTQASESRVVEILGDLTLLADCCPGSAPRQLTIVTRRKNLWSELHTKITGFINLHYGHLGANVIKSPYIKYVTEETNRTLSETPASRKSKIVERVLAKIPINVGMDFSESMTGLVDFEMMGNIVLNPTEAASLKQVDWSNATRLEGDLALAKEQVNDEMSRLPGYSASL